VEHLDCRIASAENAAITGTGKSWWWNPDPSNFDPAIKDQAVMPAQRRLRIAIDAVGGDIGPAASVPGVVAALNDGIDGDLILYGDPARIEPVLEDCGTDLPSLELVACTQDIPMDASAVSAVRSHPDSPVVRAMNDQKEGRVDAVVSAGSTGAMVAASLLILGRLRSASRPAIATFVPTLQGETLLLDAGANTHATPELLLSFARMGAVYCHEMQGIASPKVGLLNIGGEASKGSDLAIAAHKLIASSNLDFVGNIEGNEVLLGRCDVLVTDGFTGNIALKLIEGFNPFMSALAESGDLSAAEVAGFQAFSVAIQRRFAYEAYGGAPLLGVNGVSIICHGRSSSTAFAQAIKAAEKQARCRLPRLIDQALSTSVQKKEDE
jgi:phosphate acyltransferase